MTIVKKKKLFSSGAATSVLGIGLLASSNANACIDRSIVEFYERECEILTSSQQATDCNTYVHFLPLFWIEHLISTVRKFRLLTAEISCQYFSFFFLADTFD